MASWLKADEDAVTDRPEPVQRAVMERVCPCVTVVGANRNQPLLAIAGAPSPAVMTPASRVAITNLRMSPPDWSRKQSV